MRDCLRQPAVDDVLRVDDRCHPASPAAAYRTILTPPDVRMPPAGYLPSAHFRKLYHRGRFPRTSPLLQHNPKSNMLLNLNKSNPNRKL